MTWDQLADHIKVMTPEQRSTDVTVQTEPDEWFGVHNAIGVADEEHGVLDNGCPFLMTKNIEL